MLHERPRPSTPVAALLAAAAEGAALSLTDSPEDTWMRTLARWTLGSE